MFIQLNTIVIRNLLKFLHAIFELPQMFLLATFQFISFIDSVTQVIDLLLKESKSLRAVINSGGVLLEHLLSPLPQHLVHPPLTFHLFIMKRK
jgi:hypothetical protein